jgi:hypothetical protein
MIDVRGAVLQVAALCTWLRIAPRTYGQKMQGATQHRYWLQQHCTSSALQPQKHLSVGRGRQRRCARQGDALLAC